MSWSSWLPKRRRFSRFRVRDVEFTGEQQGETETVLKFRVVQLLRKDPRVTAAYLARSRMAGEENVVLCVRRDGGPETQLIDGISDLFRRLFNQAEHLDVLFLDGRQEMCLLQVCAPFYSAADDEEALTP